MASKNVICISIDSLTESRFLRQTYRPRSKWPTVNFFGLNEQVLFVDHFGKFFPKSFRGKGVIFALNVWAIPTKKTQNCSLGESNPTLPHERLVLLPLDHGSIVRKVSAN